MLIIFRTRPVYHIQDWI